MARNKATATDSGLRGVLAHTVSLDAHRSEETLAVFVLSLLVYLSAREWLNLIQEGHKLSLGVACSLTAVALWAMKFGVTLSVKLAALATIGTLAVVVFPGGSNHFSLEVIIVTVCAICDFSRKRERILFVAVARWLVIIVMFYSGLKKLIFGTYFRGTFLATRLHERGFRTVLEPLLSPSEYDHLTQLLQQNSPGPFRFESFPSLLLSNAVYATELATALLLLWPRTRTIGALVGLACLVGIEFVAREVLFGLLLSNLLWLFFPERAARKWFMATAIVAVALIPVQLWVGSTERVFN